VLQLVADAAHRLTATRLGIVYLIDRDDLRIAVLSGSHNDELFVGYRMPVAGSVAGLAIQSGQAAAPPLVKCLEDHHLDVRWRAAEDLIAFGREGLIPLLQALIEHPESVRLREGSYHVLRTLGNTSLKGVTEPVLRALEEIEPAMKVPQAAHTALHRLTKGIYSGGRPWLLNRDDER
jgi:HEAT repeat protein